MASPILLRSWSPRLAPLADAIDPYAWPGSIVLMGAGIVLGIVLFVKKRIRDKGIRAGGCPRCGYDMGLILRCSECGWKRGV